MRMRWDELYGMMFFTVVVFSEAFVFVFTCAILVFNWCGVGSGVENRGGSGGYISWMNECMHERSDGWTDA